MKISIAAALAAFLATQAVGAETTRYTALVNGGKDKAGHQTVTRNGNQYRVVFYFKDNGRGPELTEEYTLDERGAYSKYKVTGTTTFGSSVNESFNRSGDKAS